MGAVLSQDVTAVVGTVVTATQLAQARHQISRGERWSRDSYNMGLSSMKIDMINAWREEMRDNAAVTISGLDNLMVVATLMLSIGFGFAVEGTFPPSDSDYVYSDVQRCLLMLYSALASLSLVFPFACLMLTMSARREFEALQAELMEKLQGDLKSALLDAVTKTQEVIKHSSASDAEGANNILMRFGGLARKARAWALPLEQPDALDPDAYKKLTKHDIRGALALFKVLYPIAQKCLWLGMLCSVLCCSVLLGLYFAANFPETQWMWRLYSGTLCFFLLGLPSLPFVGNWYMRRPPKPEEVPIPRLDLRRHPPALT
mmetsp:Transcript_4533/g.12830  ORF Transcript_4533/g.12830 Transcript_4533/m.12830 type:complete len:317 (-) Transcript_4533:2-952(-)